MVTKSHYIEANRPAAIFPKVDQCALRWNGNEYTRRYSVSRAIRPKRHGDFNNGGSHATGLIFPLNKSSWSLKGKKLVIKTNNDENYYARVLLSPNKKPRQVVDVVLPQGRNNFLRFRDTDLGGKTKFFF